LFRWFFQILRPELAAQVPFHLFYMPLIALSVSSATGFLDFLQLSSFLVHYGLFLLIFHVLGFSMDNSFVNSRSVLPLLLPPRPPKPRGYYSRRRRHRHYF
jgi:hypothetical protein